MQSCWVAASARPVAGARWERRAAGIRIAGGGQPGAGDAGGRDRPRRPPAGAELAALLAFDDPAELRLLGIDALAGSPAFAAALDVLPPSVRTIVVDGVTFPVDEPAGRACWRLVLAGLVAHAQSRTSVKAPAGRGPGRPRSKTAATSTVTSAGVASVVPFADGGSAASGSAGIHTRWAVHEQPAATDAGADAADGSAAIAASRGRAAGGGTRAGRQRSAGRGLGPAVGAEDGQDLREHPGEIGEQRDVDLDPRRQPGEIQRQPQDGTGAGVGEVRGVRPEEVGRLPRGSRVDGCPSAVAVPVSPGKRPGEGVRGGT